MKAFTKEYAHKLLKRLKEKGKLRKPSTSNSVTNGNGHGNGHHDPGSDPHDPESSRDQDRHRNGSTSTPSATPLSLSTPRIVPDTPKQNGAHADLVSDIFGPDDLDEDEMDPARSATMVDASPSEIATPDQSRSPLSIKMNMTPLHAVQIKPIDKFRPPPPPAFAEVGVGSFQTPGTPRSGDEVMDQG